MNDALGLLGLAKRANKIVYGDTLWQSLKYKKVKLIILAQDASARTKKHILSKSVYYEVPYLSICDSIELSKAIGKINIKAIGIVDIGIANKLQEINRNEVG